MTKKGMAIFIFLLLILGTAKVHAVDIMQEINTNEELLDKLIEVNKQGSWEELEVYKRTMSEGIIYKVGEDTDNSNKIMTRKEKSDSRLFRIIKEKSPENVGLDNQKDLYMAKEIALTCVYNNYQINQIDEHYRVMQGLDEKLKQRAEKVISAVKELLNIGYNGTETRKESTIVCPAGDFSKDEKDSRYFSVVCGVEIAGIRNASYKVSPRKEGDIEYFTANIETGEAQEEFSGDELKFKIMVPKEELEKPFVMDIRVKINYQADVMYEATGKGAKYLTYTVSNRINYMGTTLSSKRSNLSIGIRDKENGNTIIGSVVEINNVQYTIDRYKKEILRGIDVGELNAKFISVPDDYILPKEDVKIKIGYKENHVENIGIIHKKGNIRVNGNTEKASYDLFDKNRTCIGSYIAENGVLDISDVNTGAYYLVQTNVPNGWKLAEKQELEVKYGETTTLEVVNEKIEELDKPEEEKPINANKPEEESQAKPNKPYEEELPTESGNQNEEEIPVKLDELQKEKTLAEAEKINKEEKMTVLPRTGNDYFILKVLLLDLNIFIIFLIIILQKSYSIKKKQTTNLKQSANPKV